ncbi:MAG TPA: alpha/beta fold hydrolase, partial [Candidatus Hydrogenedentes bacterium]|nr:alpha/beta fold hydrolase [Candidatus Hydrogenedentota bacterium]
PQQVGQQFGWQRPRCERARRAARRERPHQRGPALGARRGQRDGRRRAVGGGRGVQPPLWDALPQVTASALLLTGEGDARHAETLREMASSMADAAVELLPDCGHAAHLEAPAAFAEKVAAFVCRHRA